MSRRIAARPKASGTRSIETRRVLVVFIPPVSVALPPLLLPQLVRHRLPEPPVVLLELGNFGQSGFDIDGQHALGWLELARTLSIHRTPPGLPPGRVPFDASFL